MGAVRPIRGRAGLARPPLRAAAHGQLASQRRRERLRDNRHAAAWIREFHHPTKLFTFTGAGLALLAGAGWDRVTAGETKWLRRAGLVGLGLSLAGLVFAVAARQWVITFLADRVPPDTAFGPADIAGSWAETEQAFAHGGFSLRGRNRPGSLGPAPTERSRRVCACYLSPPILPWPTPD